MQSMKKASEAEVDKTSASLSKAELSKQPDLTTWTSDPITRASDHTDAQPMDTDVYRPPLPPKFTQSVKSDHASKHSETTRILNPSSIWSNLKGCVPKLRSNRTRKNTSSGKVLFSVIFFHIKKSTKPQQAPSEPEHQQDSTDPVFYREVDMSDLPSQYAEEVETFRQILDLPDPRETLPRSSTTVLGLDDKKGQQELRPRGYAPFKSHSQRHL